MESLLSNIDYMLSEDLIINKEYKELLAKNTLNTFEALWNIKSEAVVKKLRERTILRIVIKDDGRKRVFFLKRHNSKKLGILRFFSFFSKNGLSDGKKEFESICQFRRRNIPTVIPVAAGERCKRFFWVESFLITEDYSPFIPLEELLKDNPEFFAGKSGNIRKRILIKRIAELARKMHKNGLHHRDFSATHILVYYEKGSDDPKIALFDFQRMDKNRLLSFRWMVKCLARVNYSLPGDIFDAKDKVRLFLNYKDKQKLNLLDKFQLYLIDKKSAKIRRHTEKLLAKGGK